MDGVLVDPDNGKGHGSASLEALNFSFAEMQVMFRRAGSAVKLLWLGFGAGPVVRIRSAGTKGGSEEAAVLS